MKLIPASARHACARIGTLWIVLIAVCVPAAAEPAMWKVKGGPEPVWLFGTFHLLPPETEWQTDAIDTAFEEADILAVEARLDNAAIAETQKLIAEKAFLKGEKRLRDYLDPEDRKTFEEIGERLGLLPAVLDHYRPWFASILLSVALYMEQGFDPDSGVETVLQERAKAADMPVRQFETATEQLNFLADMPQDAQVAMLQSTLREAETMPEQTDVMLKAWKSGDTEEMDALMNDALRAFPEAYDRLLVQRNKRWLPHIEKMIADNNGYFIAVGTAHLVGKDSVVALLREKGYEVERR